MTSAASEHVHFRSSGVSLVVALDHARLPRIVHWGADLGELSEAHLAALAAASSEPAVPGELDSRPAVAIVPEHSWGWMHWPGLAGSREGRHHSTRFTVTESKVSVGGESGAGSGAGGLEVTASDAAAGLTLTITVEMLASGLVRAKAAVALVEGAVVLPGDLAPLPPYAVEQLNVFFPIPREATSLLDFTGRWIRERTPQRAPLNVGAWVRESRRGKPGHDSPFVTVVGTEGFGFRSGEVWMTHVAWSGNSRAVALRDNGGHGVIGGGELLYPGEIRLGAGADASYESPWVYASYAGSGLDEASARVHAFLRSRPGHPSSPRPVIVNTWEAAYFHHDEAELRRLAEAAAAVGAERFVLDDGWFLGRRADNAGLGDWFVDASVYPNGLRPLADHVRSLGMEFGLWVEPEMINPDSDLARAHPEWIAQPDFTAQPDVIAKPGEREPGAVPADAARLPLPARQQQVLNIAHPEAYAYIEERLHTLVAELDVAYLKWDHNRDLVEAGSASDGRPIGHLQTLAFYRLVDGLKRAFPKLEIESCAGGGGRIDLEVLAHTDRVWASDCNDPVERVPIQKWTSLLVPPEMMGAHIGPPRAHTTGRESSLGFRAGVALWGHLGIEWNVASPEAQEPKARAALAEWVALHKRWRDLLHTGTVVRSDLGVEGREVFGVVSHDARKALFALASTASVPVNPVGLLRLPGLLPTLDYRVTPVGPVSLDEAGIRARPAWFTPEGIVVRGSVLSLHGLQAPGLNPQELVLIGVEAI